MGKDATYCFNQTSDILVDENVILALNKKKQNVLQSPCQPKTNISSMFMWHIW